MKVFVAGATGAVGRPLVRQLVQAGHQVVGTTRSTARFGLISDLGAEPVAMDGLDPGQVRAAVRGAAPEVVIHQLTGLATMGNLKHFDREFAVTNRLRTEGVDLLLAAALDVGARRFVAQSFTGWPNERKGSLVKSETDPLDPDPVPETGETLAAIQHLEDTLTATSAVECVGLRYGLLYGPGTGMAPGRDMWDGVRARKLPLVGGGGGIFSFLHAHDAAAAAVLAVDRGTPGLYNVVDDEPAAASTWVPYLAGLLGAKPPRRVPAWLARPLAGEAMVSMMTVVRGSSNAKAKRELGFAPRYPSWRDGFREMALAGQAT